LLLIINITWVSLTYFMLIDKQFKTFGQAWLFSVRLGQRTHYFGVIHDECRIDTRFFQKMAYKLQYDQHSIINPSLLIKWLKYQWNVYLLYQITFLLMFIFVNQLQTMPMNYLTFFSISTMENGLQPAFG